MTNLLSLITKFLKDGIPFPLLKDIPKNVPSISYSMTYISGLLALASCSEKVSLLLGKLNSGDCLDLFVASSLLYVGRGVLRSRDGKIISSGGENDVEKTS